MLRMSLLRPAALIAVLASGACSDQSTPPCVPAASDGGMSTEAAVRPPLSAGRVLRRIHLALHGRPPLDADEAALDAATSESAREALLARAIDDGLASPDFYERMLDFGHAWMRNGEYSVGAQGDAYWGNMSTHLAQCGAMTAHPGAWYKSGDGSPRGTNSCLDQDTMGNPATAPTLAVQPWWDPNTTVTLVGDAALTATEVVDAMGMHHDCGIADEGYFNMSNPDGCGCGPNAVWCYPGPGLNIGGETAGSQRRDIWDEPARLVAHLAWQDRPLSDIVLGNYTVANNRVRAWYLRFGRQTGLYNARLDANSTWFHAEAGSLPRDPLHTTPSDPEAWRDLVVEELAPQLLSLSNGVRSADPSRTFTWDPRTNDGPAPGLPASGVFTMQGPNSSFPRERPRAARFIEIFTCREFNPPPPEQHFPPVGPDLATTGPCMNCHVLMDPVAMAFRRWIFMGYYVPRSYLADLANLEVPNDLYVPARNYTYGNWFRAGAGRWQMNWLPNTTLTPVTPEQITHNIGALFTDTIPTSYTVLGQHTDGTMGPLAFAKVLVASGEFDRCAVRRLYERVMGRPLNPGTESRYIEALATRFAADNRQVRPFIRHLLAQPEFRRGPR